MTMILRHNRMIISMALVATLQLHTMQAQQVALDSNVYEQTRDNVTITATKITGKEVKRQFGRNLVAYGFQPIAITLYNDSDDALLLRASSFDVPLERAQTVIETVQIPTLWYTVVPACYAGIYFWPALIPIAGAGYWMSSRNTSMANKVQAQVFEGDNAVEILPYEQLTKVIFVRNEGYQDEISFHIFNMHKKSFVPFTVSF